MLHQSASSGSSLMLVVAHPDDDAYGLAGTVALHAGETGFRFILVHATDGAAGGIPPGFPATRETLGAIRREECRSAWRALGREPDRHEWLDYDDGRVADVPFEELVARLTAVMEEECPDVVATFGPDGITGHPDHIAVGRAADEAFHRLRTAGTKGFHRLVHGALKESTFERWNKARRAQGLAPWDPTQVYQLRGVPDELIGVEVDASPVADRIVAGLQEHRSQRRVIYDLDRTAEQWQRSVGREYLVIGWPPSPPGSPMLHDVFEGIGSSD
ncbi:PIG-L family deacetylase [Arthrobacter sp. H5]|uniref:PIG-L deacetylase family protein n=1 Tax=Arthrobacter sp. H5 TaxID=1267973 RepID=UPI0004B93D53|nr:PIG-L family deacetylase [Arthrobacter sp. H5]